MEGTTYSSASPVLDEGDLRRLLDGQEHLNDDPLLSTDILPASESENHTEGHNSHTESSQSINIINNEQEHVTETFSIHVQLNDHTEQSDITDLLQMDQNVTGTNDAIREYINDIKKVSTDTTDFIEEMYDILECPVCLNHMTPPIILCECGHNICFKCRPFMTKCPLCRGSFLKTRNVALELIARKIGLSSDDCHKEVTMLQEGQSPEQISQSIYTCPFTLYDHCYWQGNYSDIRNHMEEMHSSKILIEGTTSTWEMNLVVKDFKVIFALNEIFFYKERLDTTNSKFYVQVFYMGQETHSQFSYRLEISSLSGKQKCSICNVTLPIEDLEHTYTYSHSHCTILDYSLVSNMSKHGDLKCKLSIERNIQ